MFRRRHPDLSIIIPFTPTGEHRQVTWDWLKRFWETHLPNAQLVVGTDHCIPFSKAVAVNDGATRARGRVFAVLDADLYMDPAVIESCCESIIEKWCENDIPTWYIPYLNLYRLNERVTKAILKTDPAAKFDFPSPPPPKDIDNHGAEGYGHQFGAMALILPREAFFLVGGFECRMRGWGGEDSAFMKSVDTLFGLHETTHNEALHLWHERRGTNFMTRQWPGQTGFNVNARLSHRYNQASNDPTFMTALIRERHE